MLRVNQLSGFGVGGGSPFLLDELGVSASVACGMRKLRRAYAGSAVRAIRVSDNAEQDIGFVGEAADWASAITFKGASSILVKTWYDQSGNANNLALATINRPTIDTTAQEIVFDGIDNNLVSGANVDLSATPNVTVFSVVKSTNTTPTQMIYETSINANTNVGAMYSYYDTGNREAGSTTTGGSPFVKRKATVGTTYHVWSHITETGHATADDRMRIYYNGTQETTIVTSANLSGNMGSHILYVGSRASGSLFLVGSMKELVILPSALNDTNRGIGESNISTFYGI